MKRQIMFREIKRAVFSEYMLLAVGCLYIASLERLIPFPTKINMGGLMSAFILFADAHNSFVRFVLVIFAILPCSIPISEEISSKCYRSYIMRMGTKGYVRARMYGAQITAYVCTLISIFLYLVTYLQFRPQDFFIGCGDGAADFISDQGIGRQQLVFFIRINMICIYAGMWSCVSLAVAAWTDNKYLIFGVAFGIENVMNLLTEWGLCPWILNPSYKIYSYGFPYPFSDSLLSQVLIFVVYLGTVIAGAWFLFFMGMKRRMAYE